MFANKKRFGFLLVALFAILTSTFRSSFEDSVSPIGPNHHSSTKHNFSSLPNSASLINIEEDVEIENGEEADADELMAITADFVQFNFATFQKVLTNEVFNREEIPYIGYSEPLYLLNNNFRV